MTDYRLTVDAENDLREIARYTRKEWGQAMFQEYRTGLRKTFEAIGKHQVLSRSFSDIHPELLVTKFKHHFIFYLTDSIDSADSTDIAGIPTIIGIIHERRNIVARLSERLS